MEHQSGSPAGSRCSLILFLLLMKAEPEAYLVRGKTRDDHLHYGVPPCERVRTCIVGGVRRPCSHVCDHDDKHWLFKHACIRLCTGQILFSILCSLVKMVRRLMLESYGHSCTNCRVWHWDLLLLHDCVLRGFNFGNMVSAVTKKIEWFTCQRLLKEYIYDAFCQIFMDCASECQVH
jgi:hypothetical protein